MTNIGRSLDTFQISFEIPRTGIYEMDIGWLFAPPGRPYQTLELTLDGIEIGDVRIDRLCTVQFFVPEIGTLKVRMPDACRPVDVGLGQDSRTLSIGVSDFRSRVKFEPFSGIRVLDRESDAVLASLKLSRADLALRVESLGDNCELGMVQRELGAEPLGLFRFASTKPASLIPALEGRLEGLGAPGTLRLSLLGEHNEYMVNDERYGLSYHTWTFARDMDPAQVLAREYTRIPFLARKFLEDVSNGDKVFVYRDHSTLSWSMEQQLFSALRNIGPSHLLVVRSADAGHAPGAFEGRLDGPCRAWIDYRGPDWWMIAETWMSTLAMVTQLQAKVVPVGLG